MVIELVQTDSCRSGAMPTALRGRASKAWPLRAVAMAPTSPSP